VEILRVLLGWFVATGPGVRPPPIARHQRRYFGVMWRIVLFALDAGGGSHGHGHGHGQEPGSSPSASTNGRSSGSTAGADAARNAMLEKQCALAGRAMDILLEVGRAKARAIPESEWNEMLGALLDTADQHLSLPTSLPAGGSGTSLTAFGITVASRLETQMVRVLLELWLRAEVTSGAMWARLQACMTRWSHRVSVVSIWCVHLSALTRALLRRNFGAVPLGTDGVELPATDADLRLMDAFDPAAAASVHKTTSSAASMAAASIMVSECDPGGPDAAIREWKTTTTKMCFFNFFFFFFLVFLV
jgi:hypothetical protein